MSSFFCQSSTSMVEYHERLPIRKEKKKKKKSIVNACVIIVLFIISSATTLWCLKSELSENILYTSKLFSLFWGLYFLIMDLVLISLF